MLHVLEERDLWAADSPARCGDGIEVWAWLCRPAASHPVLCNAWFSRWYDPITGENSANHVRM